MRRTSSNWVLLEGDEEDTVVGSSVTEEEVGVSVGSCSLFHRGWLPLTSVLFPVGVPVFPLPFPEPPLCPLGGDVGVGVTCNEVLLASIVGVLVTCQLEAPSDVRAYD